MGIHFRMLFPESVLLYFIKHKLYFSSFLQLTSLLHLAIHALGYVVLLAPQTGEYSFVHEQCLDSLPFTPLFLLVISSPDDARVSDVAIMVTRRT